jgi:hypothetical protein
MSLINYPDVPPLPGVPSLNRSNSGYVAAGLTLLGEILPLTSFGLTWAIVYNDVGTKVINPDSFVNFEYVEERKIPNYPVQNGSFSNYNKVALPFDIRLTITCNGNGVMTKEQFLTTLDGMMDTLTLFSIITPDITFPSCNLINVDYRKESTRGATMIIAELSFKEIRVTASSSTPTTVKPEGSAPLSGGQRSLIPTVNWAASPSG